MVKTQIQVDEWQYEALKKRAAQESRSMSDLIREAVTRLLRQRESAKPLEQVAGQYRPLDTKDRKRHDADWAATIR